MLEVKELNAFYGKSHVIQGVSFHIKEGEVIGILGRNGVGKTTLLRCILGLTPPKRQGMIKFCGQEISSLSAHKIADLGTGYVPQGRRIFPRLTVLENLISPVTKGKIDQEELKRVYSHFPILEEKKSQSGGTLSGGEQQMLAIGRAMMSKPQLLIIDEPTEGLQPSMVIAVRDTIKNLCKGGMTVLIADQNLDNVMNLCTRVYVIEKGLIRHEEIRENLSMEMLHKFLGVVVR
jgi:branched-chain amino acid transport system ATP-binding protein